jgi:hypothetical protein
MPATAERRLSFSDGADVMYIIDAMIKSHQQQRWISVQR